MVVSIVKGKCMMSQRVERVGEGRIITILIVPQREQFLFDSNSSGLVFDMLELEDIPGRDVKLAIRALFRKIIHFSYITHSSKIYNFFLSPLPMKTSEI